MICPVVNCRKDVIPAGLPTGLQELLAMRIHLLKDHKIHRNMNQVMEMRVDSEHGSEGEAQGTLVIDVDRLEEKWLR